MPKKKIGRPFLPKNQVKTQLLGVRLREEEMQEINKKAEAAEETPAEFMREAARQRRTLPVVTSHWSVTDLHDKPTLVAIVDRAGHTVELRGRLFARPRAEGKISINLNIFADSGAGAVMHLNQKQADAIDRSDGASWYHFRITLYSE